MLASKDFLKDIQLNPEFRRPLIDVLKPWRMKTYVDILVVVEENISINLANDFGIAAVGDLIRNSAVGCIRFRVDIALRNGDAPKHWSFQHCCNHRSVIPVKRGIHVDVESPNGFPLSREGLDGLSAQSVRREALQQYQIITMN